MHAMMDSSARMGPMMRRTGDCSENTPQYITMTNSAVATMPCWTTGASTRSTVGGKFAATPTRYSPSRAQARPYHSHGDR